MGSFFKNESVQCYAAPFDVRLYFSENASKDDQDIFTVVQPDLCAICDKDKLDEMGCIGSPDLAIEILSPMNSKMEFRTKYDIYEEAGVLEYWIVDPEHEIVLQFVLENEKYQLKKIHVSDEVMETSLFPGLKIVLEEIFKD